MNAMNSTAAARSVASLALASMLTLGASTASAGIITWESPEGIFSAGSDVATDGTTVEAFNMGAADAQDVTVNGIDFVATNAILSNSSNSDFFSGTTGDAGYDNLLSTLDFGNGTEFSFDIGGGSLTSGWQYLVQVWFTDDRSCCSDREMTVGDGDEGSADVELSASGSPRINTGQYAIGTFTADGVNQTLSLAANGFSNVHLNAYQLRLIDTNEVPTPAPLALVGAALLALRLRKKS